MRRYKIRPKDDAIPWKWAVVEITEAVDLDAAITLYMNYGYGSRWFGQVTKAEIEILCLDGDGMFVEATLERDRWSLKSMREVSDD